MVFTCFYHKVRRIRKIPSKLKWSTAKTHPNMGMSFIPTADRSASSDGDLTGAVTHSISADDHSIHHKSGLNPVCHNKSPVSIDLNWLEAEQSVK